MKVVVSIQAKRASSRGLAHYIAHSKIEPEREPGVRPLFNENVDGLSVEKANILLRRDISRARAANADLHHLVISVKADDYDKLGIREKERIDGLRKITRHAMKQLTDSIGADSLAWTAAVHLNTNNPHVHIAVRKEYFDRDLKMKSLNKFPVALLPHYEKIGGEKVFVPGTLIDAATGKFESIISENEKSQNLGQTQFVRAPIHEDKTIKPDHSDSRDETEPAGRILAEALLAKFHLERTQNKLDSLINFGVNRRFKIFDRVSEKKRLLSLSDLDRRAARGADRQIITMNVTPQKEPEVRQNLITAELEKNADAVKRIKTILHNLVKKETELLGTRKNAYEISQAAAQKIRDSYRAAGKKLPLPELGSEEINLLQEASLAAGDFRAANYFERVRLEFAFKARIPSRKCEEMAALKADRQLTELKIALKEKRINKFDRRSPNITFRIEGRDWSLTGVESEIAKVGGGKSDFSLFKGSRNRESGPVVSKNALTDLENVRQKVMECLDEKRSAHEQELKNLKTVKQTLDRFYQNDTNPDKETSDPIYNNFQLAEMERLAFELKDSEVYRPNFEAQKTFVTKSETDQKNHSTKTKQSAREFIAGRALAREIMCEVEVMRLRQEIRNFEKFKDFQKYAVTDAKTGAVKYVSLYEVRSHASGSIFDQTLEYFLESREKRQFRREVEARIKTENHELKNSYRKAQDLFRDASANASQYKRFTFFGRTNDDFKPIFTPEELVKIELRVGQSENNAEAKKLNNILKQVDEDKAADLSRLLSAFNRKETAQAKELLTETLEHLPPEAAHSEVQQKDNISRLPEREPTKYKDQSFSR